MWVRQAIISEAAVRLSYKGWPKPYIHTYVWCVYGILSREITIHAVIYSVLIRFWLTLTLVSYSLR
jgi:hypothetical protein